MSRKKVWYESKYLRKRAAFLLEDADLIPTDVSFRVGREDRAVLVHGHSYAYSDSFACAREIADVVGEEQCVAEIKRNAAQVVLSKEFLGWKGRQEQRDNTPVEFRRKRRKNDGILQHICFRLFNPEKLAAGPVMDGVFSEKDMHELYVHAFGAKELTSFHSSTRVAIPSFFLTVRIFVSTLETR